MCSHAENTMARPTCSCTGHARARGTNAANAWGGPHAVAYEAEQERMQQMDGKAVIGEAAKKDGEADMQLHGLAWRRRSIGEAEREREWRGRNAVG